MIIRFSGGQSGWVEYVLDGTVDKPRDENLVKVSSAIQIYTNMQCKSAPLRNII